MTPAFFGNPRIQAKYVNRAEQHRLADEIIQGEYWDGKRGCAVGCLAHENEYPHKILANATNIPMQIFYLADRIHENLPGAIAPDWPVAFITSIPLGADLSRVSAQFEEWQGNNGFCEASADKLLTLLLSASQSG